MNEKARPKTAVTFDELQSALQQCEHGIPREYFAQFCSRAYSASQIFLEIDEPKIIAKELREINRLARRPKYTLLNVIGRASAGTIAVLEDLKPLCSMPSANDKDGIKDYAKDIRERIVTHGRKLSDRIKNDLRGPKIKKGRPQKARIDILVSLVAAAYVSATHQTIRRIWDSDENLPFHQILETVFELLCLDASVDEAIRRLRDDLAELSELRC